MIKIPADFPVQPVTDASKATAPATCGECELTWDDAISTAYTPVPSGRCPFEMYHARPVDADDLTADEVDNYADTIDSRDVIARIEDIEETAGIGTDEERELSEELTRELDILRKLAEQGEGFADWEYGETLIHEGYFQDYYTELIQDTYDDVSDWDAFPYRHIDWEAVADEGRQDYSSIDFDGQTYYIR